MIPNSPESLGGVELPTVAEAAKSRRRANRWGLAPRRREIDHHVRLMHITYEWRGAFENAEVNVLHAHAFGTRIFDASEWDWVEQVERYSLGWVVARGGDDLVGFANVLWDGLVHAWLQDVMVAENVRRRGVGVELVRRARDACAAAGCEYLHVDFEDDLRAFYFGACGFTPTNAGLIELR